MDKEFFCECLTNWRNYHSAVEDSLDSIGLYYGESELAHFEDAYISLLIKSVIGATADDVYYQICDFVYDYLFNGNVSYEIFDKTEMIASDEELYDYLIEL